MKFPTLNKRSVRSNWDAAIQLGMQHQLPRQPQQRRINCAQILLHHEGLRSGSINISLAFTTIQKSDAPWDQKLQWQSLFPVYEVVLQCVWDICSPTLFVRCRAPTILCCSVLIVDVLSHLLTVGYNVAALHTLVASFSVFPEDAPVAGQPWRGAATQ